MKVGMFQTPFLRPERSARQVFDWAVRQGIVADEAGFSEYLIGEHATLNWEGIPCPELVISALATRTSRITLGPLAHLLPYYHPATLAVQTAWMSQILEGRYVLGVATGAYPGDAALRGIRDMSANHRMMLESIDIMQRIWKGEPFEFKGEFWSAGFPHEEKGKPLRDMRPYGGGMPMMMTGLSAPSPSINFAAQRGYRPASVYAGNAFLREHFDSYARISAENGRTPDRSVHRVVRDVFVADTDAEAKRIAMNCGLGLAWKEYLLPTYKRFGVLKGLLRNPDDDIDSVDIEYLADNVWIVGSPETVREKFQQWFHDLGGSFGTVLLYSHDFIDDPAPWEESMRRFAQDIAPTLP